MKVWIDQEQCTSSGLCEVIAPDVFVIRDDGLAHLVEETDLRRGGPAFKCTVLPGHEALVQEAVDQCPGECIFLEND
jgi:ferredoxin